jgi:SAM-dependent methyltransferase
MLWWIQIFVIVLWVVLVASLFYAWFSLAPWVPTSSQDLETVHRVSDLQPGQRFVEFGCGNGRVCSYMARQNPEAVVVGLELAYPMYLWAKIRSFWGPQNLKILFADALKYDVSESDVLYVYGLPQTVNDSLKTKIFSELKSGAKLISYVFSLKSWPQEKIQSYPARNNSKIHVYTH